MTIDLDSLEAAAKAATPGPWNPSPGRALVVSRVDISEPVICNCLSEQFAQAPKDAAFIAAVNPAAVLELIATIRKRDKAMQHLASALRVKNRALAIAQRECKYAQERATRAEQELEEWKQAAVLRWTTSVPNRAGWYWNRVAGKETLPMRLYYDSDGEYCYQVAGFPDECWLVSDLADEVGCEWAGPIDEPKEKK